jgi:hypothetical protein
MKHYFDHAHLLNVIHIKHCARLRNINKKRNNNSLSERILSYFCFTICSEIKIFSPDGKTPLLWGMEYQHYYPILKHYVLLLQHF